MSYTDSDGNWGQVTLVMTGCKGFKRCGSPRGKRGFTAFTGVFCTAQNDGKMNGAESGYMPV
jgi:hypothetical protein